MATAPKVEVGVAQASLTLRPGGVVILGFVETIPDATADALRDGIAKTLPYAKGVIIMTSCVQPFAFVINVEASDGN